MQEEIVVAVEAAMVQEAGAQGTVVEVAVEVAPAESRVTLRVTLRLAPEATATAPPGSKGAAS